MPFKLRSASNFTLSCRNCHIQTETEMFACASPHCFCLKHVIDNNSSMDLNQRPDDPMISRCVIDRVPLVPVRAARPAIIRHVQVVT